MEYKVFKEYIFTSRKHDHKNQEQVQIGKNIQKWNNKFHKQIVEYGNE